MAELASERIMLYAPRSCPHNRGNERSCFANSRRSAPVFGLSRGTQAVRQFETASYTFSVSFGGVSPREFPLAGAAASLPFCPFR